MATIDRPHGDEKNETISGSEGLIDEEKLNIPIWFDCMRIYGVFMNSKCKTLTYPCLLANKGSENKNLLWNGSNIDFRMALSHFDFSIPRCIFLKIFILSSNSERFLCQPLDYSVNFVLIEYNVSQKNFLKTGKSALLFRHLVLFFCVSDKTHNKYSKDGFHSNSTIKLINRPPEHALKCLYMISDNTCIVGFSQLKNENHIL